MSSKCRINLAGDTGLLSADKVQQWGEFIIGNYWKISDRSPQSFQIDINIVSDERIKVINKRYLNKDRPTDVIAFSLEEGEKFPQNPKEKEPLIGQIIISSDTAAGQAADYGNTLKEELAILVIHGLLHVAGWEEGKELKECQDKIASQLL
ncbi:MAG: rRNA maturation RNase YbeY [Elusimicrobiota bacterium]|nr:rRNA maturation RNase YbeY [Elusimicrobiota bacterium]